MAARDELCDHLADLLSPLGEIRYRAMFGAYGVYVDGVMTAIVDDGVLYLKADEVNRPDFEAMGMARFRPDPRREGTMPYHEVPPELIDDPERLLPLAASAAAAARRLAARRRRRAKR